MGGKLNWTALPVIVEMFGIEDVEAFVRELAVIREHQNRKDQ